MMGGVLWRTRVTGKSQGSPQEVQAWKALTRLAMQLTKACTFKTLHVEQSCSSIQIWPCFCAEPCYHKVKLMRTDTSLDV